LKAIVTGAAGFIGSHLVESLLADGQEVVGIDGFLDYYPRAAKEQNLERARDHAAFRLVEGRLQELDLDRVFDGAGVIYHLAAQAGVRSSWGRDFALYSDHNVLATQRLLEAAAGAGRPRVVYASSSSVYGDAKSLPLREDTPCQPVSPYGVTKLAGEHLAVLYHRNHGLPTTSLRFFTVYGPRQRPDMAFHRFLKAARDGEAVHLYGDGEQTRDFTFVKDAVAATAAAGNQGVPGRAYNIGGGSRVSINQVLHMIGRIAGRPLDVRREPAQKGDMRDTFADTGLAKTDLGFAPTVSLQEGIEAEYRWLSTTPALL
jgi:nucleoside-diphosphate-sugar epimerase